MSERASGPLGFFEGDDCLTVVVVEPESQVNMAFPVFPRALGGNRRCVGETSVPIYCSGCQSGGSSVRFADDGPWRAFSG